MINISSEHTMMQMIESYNSNSKPNPFKGVQKDMQMSFKQTFGPNHLNSAGLKTESGGDNVSFAKTSTIFGKGANTPFEVNKIDEEF